MATVKKKLPYELYDVAGLEDWFSRMAAEGYHLVDCWLDRAEFTVATPKENVRYRLEAEQSAEHDWDKERAYAELGWQHVATISGFFCIFQCSDPEVEELHTDPTIQSWTMKKMLRRQWGELLVVAASWGLLARHRLDTFFGKPMEAAKELMMQDVLLLLTVLTLLYVVYALAVRARYPVMLWRLKRRLASGLPIDRSKRYPRSFWLHDFSRVMLAVLALIIVIGIKQMDAEKPAVDPADYPHVSLEDVIPGQFTAPGEKPPFWTGAQLESSVLVPVQFKYGDAAVLKDGGEWVRTYLFYYEAVSDNAAEIIRMGSMDELRGSMEDQRDWHEKYPDRFGALQLDTGPKGLRYDGLDVLSVWDYQVEHEEMHRVYFGRKGSKVFMLYAALPEPERALELLIEKIS